MGQRSGSPPAESRLLDWAGTYAHVRDNLRRWRVAMDTVALVTGRLGWPMALSQTTPEPETAWLGLELPEQGSAGGRSHLAVDVEGWRALVTGRACATFVIDGWTERLPARRTTSGVAFHFDAPSSKPPQAVLVAVTPNDQSGWSEALLQRTLIETMENAQLRAVTGDELEDFGHGRRWRLKPSGRKVV
ncbi:hypothetical protein [uncultured Celeribacter sp.]|uniref:hypothetical protein n=1 Tax=uncultured Celeribacter sp. TaxID=1303376 RepID=UPI002AA8DF0D|nr:hypothetical protein [uncultured Celeribacter sp.]